VQRGLGILELTRSAQRAANLIIAVAIAVILLSCAVFYVAEVSYKEQSNLLDHAVFFSSNDTSDEALQSDQNLDLLIENNFFSAFTDESSAVFEAKEILERRGQKIDGKYFSSLWEFLDYLHATNQLEAAAIIEKHFGESGSLWSLSDCIDEDSDSDRCNVDYANQINMVNFFQHILDAYIYPAIEYFYTGRSGDGYNLIRTSDSIVRSIDIEIGAPFNYENLNKVYVLNDIVRDMYEGSLTLQWRDISYMLSRMDYAADGVPEDNPPSSLLASYVEGVRLLHRRCFSEAASGFTKAIELQRETSQSGGRFRELLSYLVVRSISEPFYDLENLSLVVDWSGGTPISPEAYLSRVYVRDCGNQLPASQYVRDIIPILKGNLGQVSRKGLRRDISELGNLLPNSLSARLEFAKRHTYYLCHTSETLVGQPGTFVKDNLVIMKSTVGNIRLELCGLNEKFERPEAADGQSFGASMNMSPSRAEDIETENSDLSDFKAEEVDQAQASTDLEMLGEWIKVESVVSNSNARQLASNYSEAISEDIAVFRDTLGTYAIALGPFATGNAKRWRDELVALGKIPTDSKVSNAEGFVDLEWGGDGLLALNIQNQLERLGCSPGIKDGDWGPSTSAAFMRAMKKIGPPGFAPGPTRGALEKLRKARGNLCGLSNGGRDQNSQQTREASKLDVLGHWIQIYSREQLDEALTLAKEYQTSLSSDASVFLHKSGLYVVAIGPFSNESAAHWARELKNDGKIPGDSIVRTGQNLGSIVWGGEGLLELNIQVQLLRLGIDPGVLDGDWGTRTQEAYSRGLRCVGSPASTSLPSFEGLNDLASSPDRHCL